MLIKVAKRGRKHGLGMCGISQRPADVKKDFITQCDWLVWHRLTWQNDTKVVRRILGSDYADGVEELNDGEGYLMTDWDEDVRRVQFQRKRTFDAGATPGLDDFERPELKSVSDDLVSDLERITEEERARESRIQELERELKDRELRIEELEAELEEARDLSEMAEQFSRAMMAHATGRPFRDDVTGYQANLEESSRPPASLPEGEGTGADRDATVSEERWSEATADDGESEEVPDEGEAASREGEGEDGEDEDGTPPDEHARPRPEADGSMTGGGDGGFEPAYEPWPDEDDLLAADATDGAIDTAETEGGTPGDGPSGDGTTADAATAAGRSGTAEPDGGAGMLVPGDESEAETGPADWDGSFDGDAGGGDILVPGETTGSVPSGGGEVPEDGGPAEGTGGGTGSADGSDETDPGEDGTDDIIVPGERDGDPTGGEAPDERASTADAEPNGPDDPGDDIIVPGEDSTTGSPSGDDSPAEDPPADEPTVPDDEDDRVPEDSPESSGARPTGTADGTDTDLAGEPASADRDPAASFAEREDPDFERPVVREVRETVESLDPVARGMLAYYRAEGPASPVEAQVAAGGDGDRTRAYGRNGELREAGLVAHAGRGQYGYALRSRIGEAHDGRLDADALEAAAERIEAAFLDRSDAPWPGT
jgi:hypothetical protein